jgi:hypothetical protein
MPLKPLGANGVKWSPVKAVMPTTTKKASTRILKITIAVFVRALWRTPRSSSVITATTSTTAGRLTTPPSPGGWAIEFGRATPKTESRMSLT